MLKIIFVLLIARPVVLFLLGLNVYNRHKLPDKGPAVIAANHNSHLDTLVIFSLYPLSKVHKLRPVAAADYFLSNPLLAWFSINVIGIIPISRHSTLDKDKVFNSCYEALDNDDILILFPEGSRGEPEKTGKIKKGLYYLVKERPATQIIPVMTHGLGRALPRGEALFVPFTCDVVIGDVLPVVESSSEMVELLTKCYTELLKDCLTCSKHE